jgi:hypothetical protein
MCDPISLIAAAGSVAAAGIGYMGEQATMKAQQGANNDWVAYQQQKAREADARDEDMRQKAESARQGTLQTMKPGEQAATAAAAEDKLSGDMLAANGGDANVKMLSGQDQNADQSVATDLQRRVTEATRSARGRIQALAGLTAAGTGFDSMLNKGQENIDRGNQAIDLQGNMRNANTRTLATAQAVPVETFVQGSNPASGISSALAGLAGSAFQRSGANPLKH